MHPTASLRTEDELNKQPNLPKRPCPPHMLLGVMLTSETNKKIYYTHQVSDNKIT